nr:serine/Arginine-related protein 53 [Ipomoea batatas]
MGSGWERFDFDKDAPLDDEEIEAAEDDAAIVKRIGQTFRFSSMEARREEQIKAAHDEAIFGAPHPPLHEETIYGTSSHAPFTDRDDETEAKRVETSTTESGPLTSLISDQVRTMQQGSWRDRARKA